MSRNNPKERQLDIGWSHGRMVDGNHRHVKCNYCGKQMHGGISRLKEHLAGFKGDVSACTEVPKEVRAEMKEHIFSKKKERVAAKFEKQRVEEELMTRPRGENLDDSDDDEDGDEDEEARATRRALKASRQTYVEEEERMYNLRRGIGSSSVREQPTGRPSTLHKSASVRPDPFTLKKQGKTQANIKAAMKGIKDAKKYLGRAVAKFFYYNHIPHHTANSPYYQPMADAFADVGRGVPPPTAWELSNTYLDLEFEETKAYLETFHSFWDEYGCTLMCDGWTTDNRRKIINFLVYSTYGTVFIDSVDASDQFQNGPYIFDLMDRYVEIIGEQRVVQVVTDNGANFKSAGQLLMQKRPHLYWSPCAAHCIDLIFSDMSKDEMIENIIKRSQAVSGFIYNHGWVLALMRHETGGKELIRPAITRFATHFIAMESIHVQRDNLRRMITSRTWSENYPKLKSKDRSTADVVYYHIHGDEFWQELGHAIAIFEPLVKVLRMVDSDDKAEMGYLYEAMDRAKEAIKKNVGRGYKKWWVMIDKRWDRQLHQDIHAAGYFLNPRLQYSPKAKNDNEVLSGFRHVVEKLEPDIGIQLDINREAELFRLKVGVFSSEKALRAAKQYTPAEWWSIIGRDQAPHLARLAMRVLSQTVSSSNCERNWTTFSLIHTKTRNRLTMERLKKLVFVHYNMRLRERHVRRKSTIDQVIDLDHIFHEEDPLADWTREIEDRVLDDRANDWLDDALLEAQRTKINQPRPTRPEVKKTYKRREDVRRDDSETESSSPDDPDPPGGGCGTSGHHDDTESSGGHAYDYSTGHRAHDQQQQTDEGRDDVYGRGSDETGHRHSAFYGGHDVRESDYTPYRYSDAYGAYGSHDMYGANFAEQSSSQGSHYMPSTEQSQPSPYDDLMTSFLGPDQMQYSYPPYYFAQPEGDE